MTEPATKYSKLTKTTRKQLIRTALAKGTFDRDALAEKLSVRERTIRNYLNEIAREESEQNPELIHVLRNVCVKNLMVKATKKTLPDKYQVAIVLSGETQRIEQKIEGAESFKVEIIDNTTKPKTNPAPP